MASIYNLVSTIDLIIGILMTLVSLFTANFVGVLLGIVIAAHCVAWEQLEKDLEKLKH